MNEKQLIFFTVLLLMAKLSFGQIGIMTTDPDASAQLDINSNNKGILIPRLELSSDLSSPDPVSSPAEGLLIFNIGIDQQEGLYYWSGSRWLMMQTPTNDTLSGPTSSTDNAITRFDGNSGKLVQNSVVTIDDGGQLANVNNIEVDYFTLTDNPKDGLLLTSDAAGNAIWQNAKPFMVKKNDIQILANAETVNFVGGSTVKDDGNGKATASFYNNSVTRNLIQLSSNDSIDLNLLETFTAIPWNIEIQKNAANFSHSNTINPSKIFVRKAGLYELNYIVNTISKSIQRKTLRIRLRVNGTTILTYPTCYSFSYNMEDFQSAHNSSSFLVNLNANDYIEIISNGQTNDGPLLMIPNQNVIFLRLIREL